jgi:poly-gamma-glutamate capsule biosynthesis protein CapA/YwtB (metallophosphatase superfamily)
MVYVDSPESAWVNLARAGNFRAIAQWLNESLAPYGIWASVGSARPGCLYVMLELPPIIERDELLGPGRDLLMRFVCHRLWELNSAVIEGVRVAAGFSDDPEIIWQQSVRISSPARRNRQTQSRSLRVKVRRTSRRRFRLRTLRSTLLCGSAFAAFVFGCTLGYGKAPSTETTANARTSTQAIVTASPPPGQKLRTDEVQAATGIVPVIKHPDVVTPSDPTVNLMFAGDVTLAESFADTIGQDYKWAFAQMDEYRQADIAMVNLENPLTTATHPLPDKQFNFKANPASVSVLKDGGIDLVTLANNHTMDFQAPGLVETLETLNKAGIQSIGAGRNRTEARRPTILEVKGQRIAYLGYYGADFGAATENAAGTNYAEESQISADIKALRPQVDWIVVNYHWGEELAEYPAEWQKDLARFTIDQGADLIVGHHPHVLQGAELYKGRAIAYSLGNFIFGGNSRSDYDTAVLKVALKDRQMKVEFLPVQVEKYQPKVVGGDRGNTILAHIASISSNFQQPLTSPVILEAQPSIPDTTAFSQPQSPASTNPLAAARRTPTELVPASPESLPVDQGASATQKPEAVSSPILDGTAPVLPRSSTFDAAYPTTPEASSNPSTSVNAPISSGPLDSPQSLTPPSSDTIPSVVPDPLTTMPTTTPFTNSTEFTPFGSDPSNTDSAPGTNTQLPAPVTLPEAP